MSRNQTVNYRFLLPQVKKEPVGNQGEVAQFIPYRLEEGVTEESIRQELEAQPHMESLLRSLDPKRRIYLLESASWQTTTQTAMRAWMRRNAKRSRTGGTAAIRGSGRWISAKKCPVWKFGT